MGCVIRRKQPHISLRQQVANVAETLQPSDNLNYAPNRQPNTLLPPTPPPNIASNPKPH